MLSAVIITFLVGYTLIVFEHPLKLDKTVPALLMAGFCWAFISLGELPSFNYHMEEVSQNESLLHHLGSTAEILFFLIGAMTIIELIELHNGFSIITNQIKTRNKAKLLWILSIMAFCLSATLDNLASILVIVSLLRRIVPRRKERIWFLAMAVLAANAGGAWSPIGDVTTTMLWINAKVSTVGLIKNLILPSLVCMLIPTYLAARMKPFRGNITASSSIGPEGAGEKQFDSSKPMFFIGILGLVLVPIFKTVTHLPPYMGMMISLAIVWMVAEYIKPYKPFDNKKRYYFSAERAMTKIEMPSILFFLGILLAVAAVESLGILHTLADQLDTYLPNRDIVILLMGVFSALFDNVPLVAASMGMYDLPMDDRLWHFIAYSAGTGGSMLIIGSAAGVAAMGMEKIDFIWFFKRISLLAFIGFISGAGVYLLLAPYLH
jgi:Na+/H+ antiporter NhaD/arsenite permease-like protein